MTYDSWKLSNGYVANTNEDLFATGNDLVTRWTEYLVNLDEDDDRQAIDPKLSCLLVDTNTFLCDCVGIESELVQGLEKEITTLMNEALD